MPTIGHLYIDQVYEKTMQPYIQAELKAGKKTSTINRSIRVVSRILTLCAKSWRDDNHIPYLDVPPLIKQLTETDKQITRPIEYDEEERLLNQFSGRLTHFDDLWTFATHTGLREQNQAQLKWEWEKNIKALKTTCFLIPGRIDSVKNTKNGHDFLLVLNSAAKAIIEKWRGRDETYVFPSPTGRCYSRFNNHPFRRARERAGLTGIITWHSARSTFATRLRAVGVNEEDRAQLLGHSNKSITRQYSWADIRHLIACVEKLCGGMDDEKQDLAILFQLNN